MKSHILSTALFLAFSCLTAFSQAAKSPVGTWELAVARPGPVPRESGTAFVTFNADHTLSGYGLTTGSFTVFTLTGTWSVDSKGRLTGNYTEVLFDSHLDASFSGKAVAGKKLEMTAVGILGKFKYNGAPMKSLPDISGSWNGALTQAGAVRRTFETYQVTTVAEFPGVFNIDGNGFNSGGAFTVSGLAIVTAKGKITAFKINDFSLGDGVATETSDIFKGKFHERQQTISLLGSNTAELDVISERLQLSRP